MTSLCDCLVALQRGPVHKSPGFLVVRVRPVQKPRVIEHYQITLLPAVTVGELLPGTPIEQILEQSTTLALRHSDNAESGRAYNQGGSSI